MITIMIVFFCIVFGLLIITNRNLKHQSKFYKLAAVNEIKKRYKGNSVFAEAELSRRYNKFRDLKFHKLEEDTQLKV